METKITTDKGIVYRTAAKDDLAAIVAVHLECFKGYFLSELGRDLLHKYYLEFYAENPELFAVAEESGTIVGFVMGMLDGSTARKMFVKNNMFSLGLRMSALLLTLNKNAWSRLIGGFSSLFKRKQISDEISSSSVGYGTLLSIAVLPGSSGKGIGQNLVFSYEELIKRSNYNKCRLSVRAENTGAIALYKKCGYLVYKETESELGFHKML